MLVCWCWFWSIDDTVNNEELTGRIHLWIHINNDRLPNYTYYLDLISDRSNAVIQFWFSVYRYLCKFYDCDWLFSSPVPKAHR